MRNFDVVPVMDREYFEQCLKTAKRFAAWVQVCPALQRLVPISREDAIDIAEDGLKFGPIWGMYDEYEHEIQFSITSQWMDSLKKAT